MNKVSDLNKINFQIIEVIHKLQCIEEAQSQIKGEQKQALNNEKSKLKRTLKKLILLEEVEKNG